MRAVDLEQELFAVAKQLRTTQPREAQVNSHRRHAKTLLRNDQTTATGCFYAVEALCGPEMRVWEPETLWLTLERLNIDLPVVNRDKLLAANTLTMVPAFWWEVHAFENTTLAFNNVVSEPTVLQEATPGQCAWAVYEAEMLYGQQQDLVEAPEFDREPVIYVAALLQRAGFLRAPSILSFAQRELTHLTQDGADVTAAGVDTAWQTLRQADLETHVFETTPLDAQLAKLATVELYVQERLKRYRADLTKT